MQIKKFRELIMKINVFISSNQTEFSEERKFLVDNIRNDPSFDNYFEVYIFEEDSAKSQSSDKVFTTQVEESDIYIGLIGNDYGYEYAGGVSATEFEFNKFNAKNSNSFFFVKMDDNADDKSKEFFKKIRDSKKYKRFSSKEELLEEVKFSLSQCIINNSKKNVFDSTIFDESTYNDVDDEAVKLFYKFLKNNTVKELFSERSHEQILECIGAGKIDAKGTFHLSNAGALFFAKDLSKFGLDYEVKMVRFNGFDRRTIIDQSTVSSSIFNLLNEFELFFNKNTKMGTFVKGIKSYDVPEYPIEAVREAFVNAIAHRDYSLVEDCITFYIYDDRILIGSPGGLPYPLTIDDLKLEVNPKHRNKTICRIFKYTKFMEHFGTGITRMRAEMLDSGLPEPEFYDTNYFKVILRGPNGKLIVTEKHMQEESIDLSDYDLNNRQIDAVTIMCNEGIKFTYKLYANHFNVSLTTSKRDLQSLVDKELINKYDVEGVMTFSSNGL